MAAHLQYAVLLRDAGSPNADAVRRAFRTFSHLTDADAIRLAANAQGILLRHLSADEARALQHALQAEGVNAALVNEAELRFLPASQMLHRIELGHDELVIHDLMGRTSAVAWEQISLVAAGAVPHVEIGVTQTPHSRLGFQSLFGLSNKPAVETRRRLETERHFILELIVGHGRARYEIQAHQFPFNFVLERPAASTTEKFVWLVREMARRATRAGLNRGARDIRDGVQLVRGYPSRQLLLDEMVWLLWSARHRPSV